jgi:hypothetical protein
MSVLDGAGLLLRCCCVSVAAVWGAGGVLAGGRTHTGPGGGLPQATAASALNIEVTVKPLK